MADSIAILGAGALGEVIASGLLRAGWDPEDITLAARRRERADDVTARLGLACLLDPAAAAVGRRVVIISVKPTDVPELLSQIGASITPDQVVVSLAAGVHTSLIEEGLGDVAVVRAMPNTPSQIDEGATALCAGANAGDEALSRAEMIFGALGETVRLDEELLDAVTGVSGTGPAYIFLLAEAMIDAGIREGLPRHAAVRLVQQTVKGAGALLRASSKGAEHLRAQVTSPGGTTAAAMHVLEEKGFRALVEDAVRAAAQRSRELGRRAGDDKET